MIKALYFKNFRLFYAGFFMSNTGNMIQTVAVSWLMYRMTDSSLMVGLLFFLKQLMMFIMSPIAGSLADSYKRRHILLATTITSGLLGVGLGVLTLAELATPMLLLLYQTLDGISMGVDMTTRQAFIKDMVRGKSFIANAIALNSLLFNIARITGPILAGFIIAYFPGYLGEGICFTFNGLSFFSVTIALLLMKGLRQEVNQLKLRLIENIRAGIRYTRKHERINDLIYFTAALGLFGFPITVLLPDFSSQILNGGAQELGSLTTTIGIGAVVGGIILATRKNFDTYQLLIITAPYIYGGAILSLYFISNFHVAAMLFFLVGLGQALIFASANSIIQLLADVSMVGRTVSLYIMLFMGATTVGSLLAGKLAELIGTGPTFFFCGVGCVLSVAGYTLKSQLRIKEGVVQ